MSKKKFSSKATDHAEWLADKWIDFLQEVSEREFDVMREVDTLRTYSYYASNNNSSWNDVSDQQKDTVKVMVSNQKWYRREIAKWKLRLEKADSRVLGNEATRFLAETIARLNAQLEQLPEVMFTADEVPDELSRRRKARQEKQQQKSA